MRTVRDFSEFIDDGIVKKQSPDPSRARFLKGESENSYSFLLEIVDNYGITDKNANTIIKLCYDIIMELIRAQMLMEGYNAHGKGAHEAEVSYLRRLDFSENDIQFADQFRYFRNGIMYYGKKLDSEYAQKVWDFLKKAQNSLSKTIYTQGMK
ncbi:MAG: hypothetical protein ABIG84_03850 [archaeon]